MGLLSHFGFKGQLNWSRPRKHCLFFCLPPWVGANIFATCEIAATPLAPTDVRKMAATPFATVLLGVAGVNEASSIASMITPRTMSSRVAEARRGMRARVAEVGATAPSRHLLLPPRQMPALGQIPCPSPCKIIS